MLAERGSYLQEGQVITSTIGQWWIAKLEMHGRLELLCTASSLARLRRVNTRSRLTERDSNDWLQACTTDSNPYTGTREDIDTLTVPVVIGLEPLQHSFNRNR